MKSLIYLRRLPSTIWSRSEEVRPLTKSDTSVSRMIRDIPSCDILSRLCKVARASAWKGVATLHTGYHNCPLGIHPPWLVAALKAASVLILCTSSGGGCHLSCLACSWMLFDFRPFSYSEAQKVTKEHGSVGLLSPQLPPPYLDAFKIPKLYKIPHHIESLNAYMKY